MAEVFKAIEFGVEGFERSVAVKRILPHVAEDEDFIAMFKDEANIAVQLQHGNIAQIFSLGHEDESFYIALEYVSGRDLRTLFERSRKAGKPMPFEQTCFIIMKVCEGLDYAHNKTDKYGRPLNIIHRDVSPPNILVSYEGEVKLCDFGVAKAAGRVSQTQAGILKGKFGYMSPEQVRGHALDRRSDVFSVGVCMWEMLTGQRLFHGDTDFSTLEKVRSGEVEAPRSVNPDIPPELEDIVLGALAADPETRFQSTFELNSKLQEFLFRQGTFYSRQDLANWMHSEYAKEIEGEEDREKQRVELVERMKSSMLRGDGADPGHRPRRATTKPPPPPPGSATDRAKRPSTSPPPHPDRASGGPRSPTLPPRPRGQAQTLLQDALESPAAEARDADSLDQGPSSAAEPEESSGAVALESKDPSCAAEQEPGGDLEWDDDELETRLFESSEPKPSPSPASRSEDVADSTSDVDTAVFDDDDELPEVAARKTAPPRRRPPSRRAPPPRSVPIHGPSVLDDSGPVSSAKPPPLPLAKIGAAAAAFLLVVMLYGFTAGGWGGDDSEGSDHDQKTKIASLTGEGRGELTLTVSPDSAVVSIDGKNQPGQGALRTFADLEVGDHQLTIDGGEAYFPAKRTAKVPRDGVARIQVDLEPREVKLVVTTKPSRAKLTLFVDGEPTALGRGSTEHPIKRKQHARYELEADANGYTKTKTPIEFGVEAVKHIKLELESSRDPTSAKGKTKTKTKSSGSSKSKSKSSSSGSSSAAKTATLKVGTEPGLPPAAVYLDGKRVADRTPVTLPVTPGPHKIQWVWKGGKRDNQRVVVKSGRTQLIKGGK